MIIHSDPYSGYTQNQWWSVDLSWFSGFPSPPFHSLRNWEFEHLGPLFENTRFVGWCWDCSSIFGLPFRDLGRVERGGRDRIRKTEQLWPQKQSQDRQLQGSLMLSNFRSRSKPDPVVAMLVLVSVGKFPLSAYNKSPFVRGMSSEHLPGSSKCHIRSSNHFIGLDITIIFVSGDIFPLWQIND